MLGNRIFEIHIRSCRGTAVRNGHGIAQRIPGADRSVRICIYKQTVAFQYFQQRFAGNAFFFCRKSRGLIPGAVGIRIRISRICFVASDRTLIDYGSGCIHYTGDNRRNACPGRKFIIGGFDFMGADKVGSKHIGHGNLIRNHIPQIQIGQFYIPHISNTNRIDNLIADIDRSVHRFDFVFAQYKSLFGNQTGTRADIADCHFRGLISVRVIRVGVRRLRNSLTAVNASLIGNDGSVRQARIDLDLKFNCHGLIRSHISYDYRQMFSVRIGYLSFGTRKTFRNIGCEIRNFVSKNHIAEISVRIMQNDEIFQRIPGSHRGVGVCIISQRHSLDCINDRRSSRRYRSRSLFCIVVQAAGTVAAGTSAVFKPQSLGQTFPCQTHFIG